jgi:hypothetical protein
VRRGRNKNDAFAVRNSGSGKATDRTIEKLLVLIQLKDVIARTCAGKQAAPWLVAISRLRVDAVTSDRVASTSRCRNDDHGAERDRYPPL